MRYKNEKIVVKFSGGLEVSKAWLSSDLARKQRVLRNRYGERVTCTCVPDGIAMHIVQRDDAYYLASMPGLSSHHALSCPSHIDDPDTSGLRFYTQRAISLAKGVHNLAVSDGLTSVTPSHMTPSAVLHYLWYRAGLHICTPKTVESRNAYLASISLLEASQSIRINRQVTRVHIPMLSELEGATHICGQVRSVSNGPYSNRITLSGDKKTAFWVKPDQWNDACVRQFGAYDEPEKPSGATWLFAKLNTTSKGNHTLTALGVVPITKQFLICSHATPADINVLIEGKRRFFVGLEYDAPKTFSVPKAVIIDEQPPKRIYHIN